MLHECRKLLPAEQNQEHTALHMSTICQQLCCLLGRWATSVLLDSVSDSVPNCTQPQRRPPALPSTSHLRPFLIMALLAVPTAFPNHSKTRVPVFKSLSVVLKHHFLIKNPVAQIRCGGPGVSAQMSRGRALKTETASLYTNKSFPYQH